MGRLGFNLVRQKEASTNVESGTSDQQNEKNENVEISELLQIIEQRNKSIKILRLVTAALLLIYICTGIYFLRVADRVDKDISDAQKEYTQKLEALQGQPEDEPNAVAESLERMLKYERAQLISKTEESSLLQAKLESLQSEHEDLSSRCAKEGEELNALRDERTQLIQKVETLNRKALRSSASQRQAPKTTTTTEASHQLFDTDRFKKLNDLVKDIESGHAIFNIGDFMRKTDEIFGI